MIKQGDTVMVDGIEATVESSWGQGRHTAYRLSDGRVVLDLQESEPTSVVAKPCTIDLDEVRKASKAVKE